MELTIDSGETASGVKRYIVPYAIGLAPALFVALTWSPAGDYSPAQMVMRGYAVPIVGIELFVIVVALAEGLLPAVRRWEWSRPALAAASALLVIAVATAAVAPLTRDATILTGFWIVHALFGLSILYLCGRIFPVRDLVRAYMAGFAIFVVEFFVFLDQMPDWAAFDWRNGFLVFTHVRHAGYYFAAIAALGLGAMAVARRRWEWAWAFATAALAIGMALWTGSRGAVLAVAAALALALLLVPAMRSVRGWGGGLASMLVAAAVVSQAPAAPHPLMGLTRTIEATSSEDVTTGRTDIWKGAVGAVKERPLFGYGEGQMREVAPFSSMVQPHSSILQVALAWGLVGLLCVLVLAVEFARRAVPAVRSNGGILVPPFTALAAIAVLSLYDGALYFPLPTSIFIACAAIIAAGWHSEPSRLEAPAARPASVPSRGSMQRPWPRRNRA